MFILGGGMFRGGPRDPSGGLLCANWSWCGGLRCPPAVFGRFWPPISMTAMSAMMRCSSDIDVFFLVPGNPGNGLSQLDNSGDFGSMSGRLGAPFPPPFIGPLALDEGGAPLSNWLRLSTSRIGCCCGIREGEGLPRPGGLAVGGPPLLPPYP